MATIWSAIASKDPKQLEALIKAGGDVNMVGGGDQTPLHLACAIGHVSLVRALLPLFERMDDYDSAVDELQAVGHQLSQPPVVHDSVLLTPLLLPLHTHSMWHP